MKLKKTKVKVPPAPAAPEGGVAIADRFRLDVPAAAAPTAGTVSRKAATVALIFGLIALAVSGILVFILYKHCAFLMPAYGGPFA